MCNKYGEFMMKYMDKELSLCDFEEMNLKKHMEVCADCREDFAAYSEILQGFDDMEIVEAPADFAPAIMAKVAALNLYNSPKKGRILDGLIFGAWAILALGLFGGAALALFGAEILTWLQGAGLYGLSDALSPVITAMSAGLSSIGAFFGNLGEWSHQTMILYSIAFLLVFVALVALQFGLSPKAKLRRSGGR
ncbi:MAG: hypothetical protein LBE35_08960 [Clostridiales bacterium]|jgi:hypothetical protein|nr:hypothetical protein [Clostridiales bacterium]